MKRYINNQLYNTDAAKPLGAWDNALAPSDLAYVSETLYRKKTGEYFLYGVSGIDGRYGASGPVIRPMAADEARTWAEANLTDEEYAAGFTPPKDRPGTVKESILLSLRPATKARLIRMREETGKSISQLVEDWVQTW